MRVVPLQLQGKGALDFQFEAEISGLISEKWKEEEGFRRGAEPTSVLERERSPSPQTSASILSASLGGGTGSADNAGVAAVSGNPVQPWPPSSQENSSSSAAPLVGESEARAAAEGLEMGSSGRGRDKCSGGGNGFGMDEWESMLTDHAAVSPGSDHSFFQLFMDDVDEPSLKQLLQSSGGGGGGGGPLEFEGGFGAMEPVLGFEGGASAPASMNYSAAMSPAPFASVSAPEFALNFSNPSSDLKTPIHGGGMPNSNPQNQILSNPPQSIPLSSPHLGFHHLNQQQQQEQIEPPDVKPQIFSSQFLQHQHPSNPLPHQNPSHFLPLSYLQHPFLPPQPKRRHPVSFAGSGQDLLHLQQQGFISENPIPDSALQTRALKMKAEVGGLAGGDDGNQQCAPLVDQLFKAAELIENGKSVLAQGILARLNQLNPLVGNTPLQRAVFYFKEALQLLLNSGCSGGSNGSGKFTLPSSANSSPYDVFFKISAYKAFSEISPILQFVNFTSNQVLLEALDPFDRIHIVDFDVGIGGQWASFMQELAMRAGRTATFLKITAFTSFSSHHPLEISLTQDNLNHFADTLNIPFQFNVINSDALDHSAALSLGASMLDSADNEAIAVNFPVGSSNLPIPLFLSLAKQLSPKIVVSADHGCVRSEFPFSQHFIHALQSYAILFDSLDPMNVNPDAACKIERFLFRSRIDNVVLGRPVGEKMPSWRALFASAGFSPIQFSNFAETQGFYMLRRFQGRGFHIERRQASLYLCWQQGELCSVSAWRC